MELTYRLTRRDLIRYFALHFFFDRWHLWILGAAAGAFSAWSMRGAPAETMVLWGVGTAAAVIGAGFVLSLAVYTWGLTRMDDDGVVLEPKRLRIAEEGLTIAGADNETHYGWSQFEWTKLRRHFLFLKLKGAEVLILLPRRDVPDDAVSRIQAHVT